ncbi:MAG: hypothetical protein QM689_02400 [Oscillospiraceae bacterium]
MKFVAAMIHNGTLWFIILCALSVIIMCLYYPMESRFGKKARVWFCIGYCLNAALAWWFLVPVLFYAMDVFYGDFLGIQQKLIESVSQAIFDFFFSASR